MRRRSPLTRPADRPHPAGAAGPVGAWRRLRLFLRLVAVGVATALLAFWVELSLVAFLPAVIRWKPVAIRSGSMAPALQVGDVILTRPVDEPLGAGDIVTFSLPGQSSTQSHRVVGRNPDGTYVTRGDANPADDSTPVPAASVESRAVLIVPWVGLPLVWLHDANWTALAGGAGVVLLLLIVATSPVETAPGGRDGEDREADPVQPDEPVTGPGGAGAEPDVRLRPGPRTRRLVPVPGRVVLGVLVVAVVHHAERRA